MSKENQKSELIKKLQDPLWRLENLYWILDKKGKKTKFKLNLFQKQTIKNLHWRMVFLKARQLGISTFIAIFFLDHIIFHEGKKAAIVADKETNAKKIFSKIEYAWEQIPKDVKDFLKIGEKEHSSTKIIFTNDSEFEVGTTIHGGTNQCLHISELGPLCAESPEKAATVMKSALPTVPDDEDTYTFIESTAEGEGNDFHARTMQSQSDTERAQAVDPENPSRALSVMEYRFMFFPWWQNPEYALPPEQADMVPISLTIKNYLNEMEERLRIVFSKGQRVWYYLKSKDLKERMKEQYPSYPEEAFLSSGGKLFDFDILKKKLAEDAREPIAISGAWKFFSEYKRGHRYAIGADVSLGVGNHHSTACVIDFTDMEVVATFQDNKIAPIPFAYELANAGNHFGTCLVAPEVNSMGYATVQKLAEIYPNVYRHHIKGYAETKETERLGWITNAGSKGQMLYAFKDVIEADEHPLKIRDAMILREALTYKKESIAETETVKRLKSETAHSDLLIAAAIAWQMNPYAALFEDEHSPENESKVWSRRLRERRFA